MSEIRYDRLYDQYIIIAPERLHRPNYYANGVHQREADPSCPFCEGNEALTTPEIFAIRDVKTLPNASGWQTRVVPNLYKALQIEAAYEHHYGAFEHWKGFGAHEVIIDTPRHTHSMADWQESEVTAWLKTLRARVADLRRDSRIAYIALFKNEGVEAGATQTHPHTQLIGLPMIPKRQREYYHRAYEHYRTHHQALMVSEIEHEEGSGERIVASEGVFTAYCPYASAYPFEVMVASKEAVGQIDRLSDASIASLGTLVLEVLRRLKVQLGYFDFNLEVITPALQEGMVEQGLLHDVDGALRCAIRIMPRIYKHAGFEVSTEMAINPVAPEFAAKLLREESHG